MVCDKKQSTRLFFGADPTTEGRQKLAVCNTCLTLKPLYSLAFILFFGVCV